MGLLYMLKMVQHGGDRVGEEEYKELEHREQMKKGLKKVMKNKDLHIGLLLMMATMDQATDSKIDEGADTDEDKGWQWMIFWLCAICGALGLTEYTIQSLRVHSLREPNEDQKNELKTDAGAAEEPSDSNGPLHMALGSSILAVSLALALTTKPRKRKGLLTFSKAERPKFIYEAKEDADVDAEGSDDEITEASHEPSSPSKAPTTLKLGPGMRFLDEEYSDGSEVDSCHSCEELEQEWEKESYFRNVQRGAVLLALVACGMIFDRFYAFWELRSCKGDQWRIFQLLQIVAMIVLAKVFAFLFMVPAMEGAGVELGERSKMLWDLAYWLVIGFFSLFFLAVNVPPFNPSCEMLALMATGEALLAVLEHSLFSK
eukprot:g16408.t1